MSVSQFKKNAVRFMSDREMMTFGGTIVVMGLAIYWVALNLPVLLVVVLLAYLLDGIIDRLQRIGCNHVLAVAGTLIISLLLLGILALAGIPRMTSQVATLADRIPEFFAMAQDGLDDWLASIPVLKDIDSKVVLEPVISGMQGLGENVVSMTFTNVAGLFALLVYAVLMPLLLFFILRDKDKIFAWFGRYTPHTHMLENLKVALNEQFGAYVRGKIIEGLVIFVLSLVSFAIIGLDYAFTLAVAVGLSVIIPFVGAVAVTFPVVIVGLLQFGVSAPEFWWVVGLYTAIQTFDGQILVPLLFSEVVKMHPVAILVAILFFGSIWGVWGVFFAIPLASLIKSLIYVVELRFDSGPS